MTDDCAPLLDVLHDDLKTHLIVRRSLMTTPWHPRSVKPYVTHPEFTVLRAPLPMFVLRHSDSRDIAFIGSLE